MKKIWLLPALFSFLSALAAPHDSLMNELAGELKRTALYDSQKNQSIRRLEVLLKDTATHAPQEIFDLNEKLFEEYKVYSYKEAFRYATSLLAIAYRLNEPAYIVKAKLKLCFILHSSGLYKEAYDSLSSIRINPGTNRTLKAECYTLMGRYYYDLAEYANDSFFTTGYIIKGSAFIDSALNYYDKNGFEYAYYSGLKYLEQGNTDASFAFFNKIIQDTALGLHRYAIAASSLSKVCLMQGKTEDAIQLLIKASLADLRSSTKETFAIFQLAELLYNKGDLPNAALCIASAAANAQFYGARQRKLQISTILPLVEAQKLNAVEARKNELLRFTLILAALVILLVILTFIILKQVKQLRRSQQLLTESHLQQQAINKQLEGANKTLAVVNEKLEEANTIKEEYIGYFFNMDSEFFARLNKFKTLAEQKLADKKYDEIKFLLHNLHTKREKEELLNSFDKVFLKLFPGFVKEFNALLLPEDRVQLKDKESLNTDMRIFALLRMGISDHEKIAEILEYSVKTIYAYKTRIRNKSIAPKEFEERIMKIKGFHSE
ncbi:DUF6377 domain-containing protein [Filimonas effusa]|uniref:Tetratricopeptide repeat protein n=1 Tax=Filimonas effusa TaxID=2508721 RepID=A0A4V1MAC6_9BACT|nr:DUF6377 domain-containing protein [Filimonas effusa]RXK85406.1 tetratricopeptide repeat protein [Filimonas effusa]